MEKAYKTKKCSFCGKDVPKLFYANPKCCPNFSCIKAYKDLKSKKGINIPVKKKSSLIKPVSDKRANQLKVYRKLRDQYLKENPICEFPGCQSREVTLHHMAGRIGLNLIDKFKFRSLCLYHHRWVEEHPEEAKEMNLSMNRL